MKSGMGRLLTFIMAAFLLVFAGYHAYRHFASGYTTENASAIPSTTRRWRTGCFSGRKQA